MSPFPHSEKVENIVFYFIVLEIVCGKLRNRQMNCNLKWSLSVVFYIVKKKIHAKFCSLKKCEISDKLIQIKVCCESCHRLQVQGPEEEAKVKSILSSWTLSLMFVFSSPLSSTFANVIVKKLFLGNLRKRPRWNVKQRNCVQLTFLSNQDWELIPPDSGCPSRPASWKRQSRWRAFNFVIDYEFIFTIV